MFQSTSPTNESLTQSQILNIISVANQGLFIKGKLVLTVQKLSVNQCDSNKLDLVKVLNEFRAHLELVKALPPCSQSNRLVSGYEKISSRVQSILPTVLN